MSSPVAELLGDFSSACRSLGARWYLFGAQAALLYGSARLTGDADVTVDLGLRSTRALVDALAHAGFELRVSDVEDFVERTRVLPLTHVRTNMPIDVVVAGPGLEELFLERAKPLEIAEGLSVPVAIPEDLIAMKILAGRSKDSEDVLSILTAQEGDLDLALIRDTLGLIERALCQSDLLPAFEALWDRAGERSRRRSQQASVGKTRRRRKER